MLKKKKIRNLVPSKETAEWFKMAMDLAVDYACTLDFDNFIRRLCTEEVEREFVPSAITFTIFTSLSLVTLAESLQNGDIPEDKIKGIYGKNDTKEEAIGVLHKDIEIINIALAKLQKYVDIDEESDDE